MRGRVAAPVLAWPEGQAACVCDPGRVCAAWAGCTLLRRSHRWRGVPSLTTTTTATTIPRTHTHTQGLNEYNWWSEATHGLSHVNNSGATPGSTNFAFPITTAASFNRSLWSATGAAISTEARAFMNAGHAYSTYWAPVINLAREPRWGRNLECAGEDPFLAGEYATAFVTGFEHLKQESRYLAASACCKHYVANSTRRQPLNIHPMGGQFDPVRPLVCAHAP